RSDLERKRLFAVAETTRLPASSYTPQASAQVYATLLDKAQAVLSAGQSGHARAVYAAPAGRAAIEGVGATARGAVPGLLLSAAEGTLLRRVEQRRGDASDATGEVVRRQLTENVGPIAPTWVRLEAGGSAEEVQRQAAAVLVDGSSIEKT